MKTCYEAKTPHPVDIVDDMDIVDNHPNDIVIYYVVLGKAN